MKGLHTRRNWIAGAVGAAGALVAVSKPARAPLLRGVYSASDALTFAAHRAPRLGDPWHASSVRS